VTPLADALRQTAERLRPHRQGLVDQMTRALASEPDVDPEVRTFCESGVDRVDLIAGVTVYIVE
jgi:hypothetical protein